MKPVERIGRSNSWLTPDWLLERVRVYFQGDIPLDPAAEIDNTTRAIRFYSGPDTPAGDGLTQAWDYPVFVNPPYSTIDSIPSKKPIFRQWAEKIYNEANTGTTIIALLPCGARFSTRYFQANILSPKLNAVCFIAKRVDFIDANTHQPVTRNLYDSALWGYNVNLTLFGFAFKSIGKTFCLSSL